MTHEYLNDGEPLPADHKKYPNQLAVKLMFPDGTTQMVYASDERAMTQKVLSMYANTRARNAELKDQLEKPSGTPPPVPVRAATTPKLTPDQKVALAADLNDPGKAAGAIVSLVKDATGLDLEAEAAKRRQDATVAHRRAVVEEFMAATPDFYPSPRNGRLLRDRVIAQYGVDHATASNYAESYTELLAEGLLESAPVETQETPESLSETAPERLPAEPSAPVPARPKGTGTPPSRLGAGSRPAPASRLTREAVFALSPSEYAAKLRDPRFMEDVNRLFPNGL